MILQCLKHTGRANYDAVDKVWYGEVISLKKDVVTFQAESKEGVMQAMKDSLKVYFDLCEKQGSNPEVPQKALR